MIRCCNSSTFKTGDGIEPQLTILEAGFRHLIPAQVPAYLEARQQRGTLALQDPEHDPCAGGRHVGAGASASAPQCRQPPAMGPSSLPALVLLGLIGNAIICGTFSNPHDRYQSRIIWLPSLVLLLAVTRDRRALQPVAEAGS